MITGRSRAGDAPPDPLSWKTTSTWFGVLKLGATYIAEFEIALRLAVAVLFASAIGFERELREEPAGLRTHMLTALAAAMFTMLTFEIFHATRSLDDGPNVDPLRLIEAVTTGVSFLAAGTIINARPRPRPNDGRRHLARWRHWCRLRCGLYAIAAMGAVMAVLSDILLRAVERHILGTKPRRDNRP